MNIPKIRESPPPTNVVNSGNSNKARTNFPPTTRMPFPVETNKTNKKNTVNFITTNKATTNFTPTTRVASPVATEEQSLTAFFEKKNNAIAPNTNLLGMNPRKNTNLGLTALFANNHKNNSRKNKSRKNRKNRKNRKGNTRRS